MFGGHDPDEPSLVRNGPHADDIESDFLSDLHYFWKYPQELVPLPVFDDVLPELVFSGHHVPF